MKLFVVDTSVLLYDSKCFKNFKGNVVILPMVVLEEIDKFKSREGILGENAREVNRFLDELRLKGSLHDGIHVKEYDIFIKVTSDLEFSGLGIDESDNDNKIIAAAAYQKNNLEKYVECSECEVPKECKIITKDINLRVKSDALNIKSDDYYADYIFLKENKKDFYQGFRQINVDTNIVNDVYNSGYVNIDKIDNNNLEIYQNEFLILKNEINQSVLCIRKNDKVVLVKEDNSSTIKPKNKDQIFALNLLEDDSIPLVSLTGVPGSGKTYLALMTALRQIEKQKKQRIIFTRPVQTVGKDIGFLPGTLNEKMTPWLAPIVDNFRNQFGDLAYFELMMEKGIIDIAPLSYIRGRSFNDSIIIVDEAQNATVHELKTVITRTGKNSKIILLGDIEQIDLPM